jgi:hypothetical protein
MEICKIDPWGGNPAMYEVSYPGMKFHAQLIKM